MCNSSQPRRPQYWYKRRPGQDSWGGRAKTAGALPQMDTVNWPQVDADRTAGWEEFAELRAQGRRGTFVLEAAQLAITAVRPGVQFFEQLNGRPSRIRCRRLIPDGWRGRSGPALLHQR